MMVTIWVLKLLFLGFDPTAHRDMFQIICQNYSRKCWKACRQYINMANNSRECLTAFTKYIKMVKGLKFLAFSAPVLFLYPTLPPISCHLPCDSIPAHPLVLPFCILLMGTVELSKTCRLLNKGYMVAVSTYSSRTHITCKYLRECLTTCR